MDHKHNNEIWVTQFTEDSAKKFRAEILEASRLDHNRPLIVYIDSYGGAVDSLAAMIETLDETPNAIITVAIGKAMSCGAVLLSHGDIRFCGKHSRIMVHEVSSGTIGNVHDMHADVQEVKRLNEYFMGLLAKNCGLKSYSELHQILKDNDGRELYLDAQNALKFGIVDAVGSPRVIHGHFYEIKTIPEKKEKTIKKKNPSKKKAKNPKPNQNKKGD